LLDISVVALVVPSVLLLGVEVVVDLVLASPVTVLVTELVRFPL
jgi:hypothetical protein